MTLLHYTYLYTKQFRGHDHINDGKCSTIKMHEVLVTLRQFNFRCNYTFILCEFCNGINLKTQIILS